MSISDNDAKKIARAHFDELGNKTAAGCGCLVAPDCGVCRSDDSPMDGHALNGVRLA